MEERREAEIKKGKDAFKPLRDRKVSPALRVYARFVSSADLGAVRIIED